MAPFLLSMGEWVLVAVRDICCGFLWVTAADIIWLVMTKPDWRAIAIL